MNGMMDDARCVEPVRIEGICSSGNGAVCF
jgi:hypothetical protein